MNSKPNVAWRESFRQSVEELREAGIEDAEREAALLLELSSGRSLSEWIVDGGVWAQPAEKRMRELTRRRAGREPYHYLAGIREFMGLSVRVDPAVLIPRPETELLVATVLAQVPDSSLTVVDVGTGSGAIALALRRPAAAAWTIVATENSAAALQVARSNGAALGLKISWRLGSLLEPVAGPVDVIVANLPYVDEAERGQLAPELAYEPPAALFAGRGGLAAIESLVVQAALRFARFPSGVGGIFLEMGQGQAPAVTALLSRHGFGMITAVADYAGVARIAVGWWRGKG